MIRLILIGLFLILFFLIGLPIQGIAWIIGHFNKYWKDLLLLRVVQYAFRFILLLAGVKTEVYGEENIPAGEAVLYVGNHRSFFDVVVTYARCPGLTGYVAKDSLLKVPFLSTWMKYLYCLFLDRNDIRAGMKTILKGIEQLQNGISMCIFPEGTRSTSDSELDMLPFKEGSLKMAEKTGCAIIPMALVHTADVFEKHLPFIHSTHVILMYGAPIYPGQMEKEQRKHLGAYTQAVIRDMIKKELELSDKKAR